jgi:glycosyltransferase involved in cell wall biosynthesis
VIQRCVLQVVGAMERGGIQNVLMQLVRRLDLKRYQADFLTFTPDPQAYDDELRRLGCRLVYCPRPRNPRRFARNFAAAMRTYGPYDAVHSHLYHYNGVIMRLAAHHNVPVRIAHSHDDQRALWGAHRLDRRLYGALMRRWIQRYASLKVAASIAAATPLFGPDWRRDPKTGVIHYGIDFTPFVVIPEERGRLRHALGLPPDAPVIGHVGRFAEQKNHAFLLDIIAAASAREPRLRVLLIGEGPLRPGIEARARDLGIAERVVFAGGRDDVPSLMLDAMDVFVFPSLHEGLGIVLLEAQAAGLPCVLSDRVPEEAEVVPGLTHRLPLGAPPERWARTLLAALRHRPVSHAEALAAMRASSFNITRFVDVLARLYDGEPLPPVLNEASRFRRVA